MKFITWLKSLFNREKEKMSDQSVVQPEAATPVATETPAATETPVSTDTDTADQATAETDTTATSSPLEQAKAKFDAFVEFVEHGLEVLGEDAEADLVALKDKFL